MAGLCVEHGFGARLSDLAHILGQPVAAIEDLRNTGTAKRRERARATFANLFSLWHGRAPEEGIGQRPSSQAAAPTNGNPRKSRCSQAWSGRSACVTSWTC